MRIAIVGSGVTGLTCAHVLGPEHEVTLFEASSRLGGHANTVTVDDPEAGELAIDTGFIVHNDRNYPNLVRLFAELGVEVQDTEMSFGVTDRSRDLTYRATSLNTLLADRRNLVRRDMWRMVADIIRFWRTGRSLLDSADPDPELTLGEFVERGRFSKEFVDLHLIPMGAAVWSADPLTFDRYPAISLLRFFQNHGLLGVGDRPQWRTVVGGSRTYVDEIAARFRGDIRLASPVSNILRDDHEVVVSSSAGRESFDHVILACHTDQSLEILADADPDEKELLGAVAYQPNRATLHTDLSVLPPRRRAWAAWNYDRAGEPSSAATVTYDLTTLQRLSGPRR